MAWNKFLFYFIYICKYWTQWGYFWSSIFKYKNPKAILQPGTWIILLYTAFSIKWQNLLLTRQRCYWKWSHNYSSMAKNLKNLDVPLVKSPAADHCPAHIFVNQQRRVRETWSKSELIGLLLGLSLQLI